MYWGSSILQEYSLNDTWISKSVLFILFFFILSFIFHSYSACQGTLWEAMCRTMLPVAMGAHTEIIIQKKLVL